MNLFEPHPQRYSPTPPPSPTPFFRSTLLELKRRLPKVSTLMSQLGGSNWPRSRGSQGWALSWAAGGCWTARTMETFPSSWRRWAAAASAAGPAVWPRGRAAVCGAALSDPAHVVNSEVVSFQLAEKLHVSVLFVFLSVVKP